MKSMKLSTVLGVLQLCSIAYAAETAQKLSPTRRSSAQSGVIVPAPSVFSHVPSMPSSIGDLSTPEDQKVAARDVAPEHDQGAFLGTWKKLSEQSKASPEKLEVPPLQRRKTEQHIVKPKEEGRVRSALHYNSFPWRRDAFESEEEGCVFENSVSVETKSMVPATPRRRDAFESEEEGCASENSVSVETKSMVPATPLMIATRLEAILEDW